MARGERQLIRAILGRMLRVAPYELAVCWAMKANHKKLSAKACSRGKLLYAKDKKEGQGETGTRRAGEECGDGNTFPAYYEDPREADVRAS